MVYGIRVARRGRGGSVGIGSGIGGGRCEGIGGDGLIGRVGIGGGNGKHKDCGLWVESAVASATAGRKVTIIEYAAAAAAAAAAAVTEAAAADMKVE